MNSVYLNINWEAFHFLRPEYLWLLVPAFIALILGLITIRRQEKWQKNIAPHLRKYVIHKGSEKKIKGLRIFTIIIIALAVLGLAGPAWEKIQIPGQILETPVVIVLDLSQSMMAEDLQPNRLERAKFKIYDLLKANPQARIALIGFAGTAHTIVPLTADYSILKSHIDGLRPGIMPVGGTNLQEAIQLADTLMLPVKAPGRIIIFTDDFTDETLSIIKNQIINNKAVIDILPVNTVAGADIINPETKLPFKNKQGKVVHSSLNQSVLKKLSALDNVNVHSLTLDNSDMQLLAKLIKDKLSFREKETEKEDEWEDRGLIFIIPLAFLVLLWFRKGWVIYSLVLMINLTACNDVDTSFNDLFVTKDYQAQREFDKGKYEEAAKLFQSPIHQGVAWYKAGRYEEAIKAFEQDSSAVGAYNLGLAYFKNGDYDQAAVAFENALELNPQMGDAAKNKELIQQLITDTEEPLSDEAQEFKEKKAAKNRQNKDMEDLGGGGQEATKKDMEKERKEETAATGKRKGKEMEDVPENFESGKGKGLENIYMQRIDDDPSLFLKRKFRYQLKKGMVSPPKKSDIEW